MKEDENKNKMTLLYNDIALMYLNIKVAID